MSHDPSSRSLTRRAFGTIALAGVPAAWLSGRAPLGAQSKIDSTIKGVHIGAITYSFRAIPDANDILKAYTSIGLSEMELMSNHAEALAGAPAVRGGGRGAAPVTPDEQAAREAAQKALAAWRASATESTFRPVRQKIANAGVTLRLLCYNMNVRTTTDADIDYAFLMAKGLAVGVISTSTQVSMAKRLAPFAEKHKIQVGFHGHAEVKNPDEVATPESFAAVLAASKYFGANLDVGHYTAAGYDPIAFIQANHARITNLHLKDRQTPANGGANLPWGQGDTPIKGVLQLLARNKWTMPANIEFEYPGDPLAEVAKCLQYCREALG